MVYIQNPLSNHIDSVKLTIRETEILDLFCQGYTCKEVAVLLFLSSETVRSHRKNLYSKLDVRTGVQLGAVAHMYLNNLLRK